MNFDGLWQILENSVPPEITHYQRGEHPGVGWWLKTVVPTNSQSPIYLAWDAIQQKHPRLVRMEPTAYDWFQTPIVNTSSVWINQKVDVTLSETDNQFSYVLGDYDTSFNIWGVKLIQELEQQKSPELDPHDWHKLCDVAYLMKSWTTDRQANNNRKGLKIVKHEKNTSSAHNRSKLDSQ